MQKVFNTLAGLSFLMSGAVLGAGIYGFMQLPTLKQQAIDAAKEMVGELVSGAVTDAMPSQVKEMIPVLPTETGPALPF
jgi:hypothetical protein